MATIIDLQSLLEKRAKDKLNKDIENYIKSIKENPLFKAIADYKGGFPNNKDFEDWIYFESDGYFKNIIYNKMLPEYIEKESKDFLLKVENIQTEIDDLKNQISY